MRASEACPIQPAPFYFGWIVQMDRPSQFALKRYHDILQVTPAPAANIHHDAAGAATGAAATGPMTGKQAYLSTHASSVHASNAALDDFMLTEVGPAGLAF